MFRILFLLLILSTPSWSLTLDDLVERDGLYYQKFSNVPFTGKVEGQETGNFERGQKTGWWEVYWESGQLRQKCEYIDGKKNGPVVSYHDNGQVWNRGFYKDGNRTGSWLVYDSIGYLSEEGSFQNDKKIGTWIGYWDRENLWYWTKYNDQGERDGHHVSFHRNGLVYMNGNYQNGKRNGVWIGFHPDGSVDYLHTGTYKNGVKLSD